MVSCVNRFWWTLRVAKRMICWWWRPWTALLPLQMWQKNGKRSVAASVHLLNRILYDSLYIICFLYLLSAQKCILIFEILDYDHHTLQIVTVVPDPTSPIALEPCHGHRAAVLSLLVRLPTGEQYTPRNLVSFNAENFASFLCCCRRPCVLAAGPGGWPGCRQCARHARNAAVHRHVPQRAEGQAQAQPAPGQLYIKYSQYSQQQYDRSVDYIK